MVKTVNFGQNCEKNHGNFELLPKSRNLVKIVKFGQNCEIWSKLSDLVKTVSFGRSRQIWSKLSNLVNIMKFGMDQGGYLWVQGGFLGIWV